MKFRLSRSYADTDGMLSVTLAVERGDGYGMSQEIFVYPNHVIDLGTKLQGFPQNAADAVDVQFGSPEADALTWVRLRAYIYDASGHSAFSVSARHNPGAPYFACCDFSMPIQAASLNSLGKAIEAWANAPEVPLDFEYRHVG